MANEGPAAVETEIEPEPPVTPATKEVSVDLSEPDDDDEPGQPETLDRKGRRSGWKTLKSKLEAKDKDISELREKLARLEGRVSAPQAPVVVPQQRETEVDPLAAQIDEIADHQQALAVAIRSAENDATAERLSKQWQKLDRQRRSLEVKQAIAEEGGERGEPLTQDQIVGKILSGEFPQIYADPGLRMQAHGIYLQMIRREGKPQGMATARAALERVAGSAGLGRKPAPSEEAKAKYGSVPARAGGQGAQQTYTPDKYTLRTAIAYCDTPKRRDLSDEEKVRIWVKEVGKPSGLVT